MLPNAPPFPLPGYLGVGGANRGASPTYPPSVGYGVPGRPQPMRTALRNPPGLQQMPQYQQAPTYGARDHRSPLMRAESEENRRREQLSRWYQSLLELQNCCNLAPSEFTALKAYASEVYNCLKSQKYQTVEALKAGLKEIQRGIDAMRSEWLGSTSMGSPSSSSSASSTASRCSTQISQITDSLYLCSARAVSEGNVRALGITCVVNVTLELPFMPLGTGIEYMKIQIVDSPASNLAAHFDAVADKVWEVRRKGGRTLMHCVAGVSRSAALCMVYLIKYEGLTLREAYYHVRGRRPIIRPNIGFFRQMIEYEKRILGKTSVSLVPNPVGPGTGLIPDVYEEEYKAIIWEQQLMGGARKLASTAAFRPPPGLGVAPGPSGDAPGRRHRQQMIPSNMRHGGGPGVGVGHLPSGASSAPPLFRLTGRLPPFMSSIAQQT